MLQVECVRRQEQQFMVASLMYLQQFQALRSTAPHKYTVNCRPHCISDYQVNLCFEFPRDYPHSQLRCQVEVVAGLTRNAQQQLTDCVEEALRRGFPTTMEAVESARTWMQQHLVQGRSDTLNKFQPIVIQVFQRPKFAAFTPVTVETFARWKVQFQASQKIKIEKKETKPTGREWFMTKHEEEVEDQMEDEEDALLKGLPQIKDQSQDQEDLFEEKPDYQH